LAGFQQDIKKVIAYSTLSQLGYMVTALGASAYPVAMFHLFTHAFFKALLFLAAGSVIIATHHNQNIYKMGGLWRTMPFTYITFLIGCLALAAIPPFSGFFSKEAIIEAVQLSTNPASSYAYFCVVAGAFLTAFYSFRVFFLVFHTKMKMANPHSIHESPASMTLPLIILAIPSALIGAFLIEPLLYANTPLLQNSITIYPGHTGLATMTQHFSSIQALVMDAMDSLPFWLTLGGVAMAWVFTIGWPALPQFLRKVFAWPYKLCINNYGFDSFNALVFVKSINNLGTAFYRKIDLLLIDKSLHALARMTRWVAFKGRKIQTGYLYHYAFSMVLSTVILFLLFMMGY
jgi:NADH-quinone oxidoreductase subunit L